MAILGFEKKYFKTRLRARPWRRLSYSLSRGNDARERFRYAFAGASFELVPLRRARLPGAELRGVASPRTERKS
jgi:hypothetical protein